MITKAILEKADVMVQGDSVYFFLNKKMPIENYLLKKKMSLQIARFDYTSSHCGSTFSIVKVIDYAGWVITPNSIFLSYHKIGKIEQRK